MKRRPIQAVMEDFVPLNEQQRRCKFDIALAIGERDKEIESLGIKYAGRLRELRQIEEDVQAIADSCTQRGLLLQECLHKLDVSWVVDHFEGPDVVLFQKIKDVIK